MSSVPFLLSYTPKLAPLSEIEQFCRVENRWHPGTSETALQTSLRLWGSHSNRHLAARRAFFFRVFYGREGLGSEDGYEGDVESGGEGERKRKMGMGDE